MHAHIGTLKTQTPLTVSALYMRSAIGGASHDFINIELRDPQFNSISIRVPVEHVIAFHAAMVDVLSPHVDEQRATQLTAAEEKLVDLIASGAKLTIREDALAKAAPRDPAIQERA